MSLIDEALKRAELEAARRDGLKGGAYPWVLEEHTKRRRPWGVVGAVVVVAGIVAGGVVWLSRGMAPVPAPVQSPMYRVQSSPPSAPAVPSQELRTVEVAPPPRGMPSRAPAGEAEKPGTKVSEEPRRDAPKPAADSGRGRTAAVGEPRAAAVAADGKASRGSAEKTYVGEVTVPDGAKIELGGIVYSEANPVALINGKVLGPGAVVEEFTIVSIQPDRVELRGRGITMFIALK